VIVLLRTASRMISKSRHSRVRSETFIWEFGGRGVEEGVEGGREEGRKSPSWLLLLLVLLSYVFTKALSEKYRSLRRPPASPTDDCEDGEDENRQEEEAQDETSGLELPSLPLAGRRADTPPCLASDCHRRPRLSV